MSQYHATSASFYYPIPVTVPVVWYVPTQLKPYRTSAIKSLRLPCAHGLIYTGVPQLRCLPRLSQGIAEGTH